MRRATWDNASSDLTVRCSSLLLEGATLSQPQQSSRAQGGSQRSSQQHQSLLRSSSDSSNQQTRIPSRCQSRLATHAAVPDTKGNCAALVVSPVRPSHSCQPSTPTRADSPQVRTWNKQPSQIANHATNADAASAPDCSPASPLRPSSSTSVPDRGASSGPKSAAVPPAAAVQDAPEYRQAVWDSQKRLAFTPPASLSGSRGLRRVSLGLPGGGGSVKQNEDSPALCLPPLMPQTARLLSAHAAAAALAAATAAADPNLRPRSTDRKLTCSPVISAEAKVMPQHSSWNLALSPEQLGSEVQRIAQARRAQMVSPSPNTHAGACQAAAAAEASCSGEDYLQLVAKAMQPQSQQPKQAPPAAPQPVQPKAAAVSSRQAAKATDTGQVGPPITRMRPVPVQPSSSPARKPSSKGQVAVDSLQSAADAILLDALLCGWEQPGADGDLYPMTLALEREGEQGADLQKLQFASKAGLQLRSTNPPLPHGAPVRSKAGKSRPQRRWQQE